MKKITSLLMLLTSIFTFAQTPCNGGVASGFPCDNYDLQARVTPGQMNASFANDSWGWTDPNDGKEYAIIGLDNGTGFVDISDPINPVYLGKLPTQTTPSTWRDVKVYDNHAFVVSEAGGHGMQVFDLTRLRSVANPPETFTNDAHYDAFGDAHNIVINEDSGYAYIVGSGLFSGGPHFVDISDPVNPVGDGGYSFDGYTHDAQVVTYSGPDGDYTGQEIMIGSNSGGDIVVILDITDKSNPIQIASFDYSNVRIPHQGWFTEDQRYFLLGDEGDESNLGFNTRTIVLDLLDLDNPIVDFEYFGTTSAIDHNGYVVGDKFYQASYSAGIRILDISDIENGNINEMGFFDTFPPNNSANFSGVWNVYPFFASENIIITGDAGLTIVKESEPPLAIEDESTSGFSLIPNPASNEFTLTSTISPINQIEIYSMLGQRIINMNFANTTSERLDVSSLTSGMYLVKINNTTSKRLVVK